MALTTPNLGLIVWNLPADPYDSTQLAGNFAKLDEHDHTPGKGAPITTAAIADGAITSTKLASNALVANLPTGGITNALLAADAVTTDKILNGTVTGDDLSPTIAQYNGVNSSTVARRGRTNIATAESTSSTAYTSLPTPDLVSNVVLPTDGLIVVAYQAIWQNTVTANGKAAIFIGANQLRTGLGTGAPTTFQAEATGPTETNDDGLLGTYCAGLITEGGAGPASETTTGQVVGGRAAGGLFAGPVYIFAAAGTYNISVQFKNVAAGTLTVKNRHLWVWTLGF